MFLRYLTVVCLLATAITETTTLVSSSTISSTIHGDTGPPASTTTTPAPPTAATEISTTPAPVNPTIPVAPTLPPIIGCPANPCPPQSECLDGVCLCISGTFLQDGQCIAAQVFPGKLHLNSDFQPGMEDRSSEIFRETAQNISDAVFKALNGTQGYVRSEVVKLEPGSVIATVNNIYENIDVTEEEIQKEIQDKIEEEAQSNELLTGATFNITDLCEVEPFPCDVTSTTCSSTNGVASCSCKEGYVPSPDSNSTCILNSTTPAPVNPTIPVAPTLPPIIGCPANPCPLQSECLDGVCLCISGTFLQNNQCKAAQVFPGKLHLNSDFQPGMENRSSEIFRETAQNISDAVFKALYGTQGYVRSEVVKLEPGSVIATVNNIYQNTDITEAEIQEKIENATDSNELLSGATFNSTDLCEVEPFPCDKTSTTCSSTNGVASCSCKEGYVPSLDSNTTCIVIDLCEVEPFPCDKTSTTCSSTNGMVTCSCKEGYVPSPDSNTTCIRTDLCEVEPFPCDKTSTTCSSTNGMVTCSCKVGYIDTPYSDKICIACPSGQRAEDNVCKPCSFGYSGFNCDESSLLAVVVVSCVLGGILLIVLILFAFCFC